MSLNVPSLSVYFRVHPSVPSFLRACELPYLSYDATDALVVQYADDTQVMISEPKSNLPALFAHMESALSALGGYFLCNGLKVYVTKLELLTIGTRQNLRSLPK